MTNNTNNYVLKNLFSDFFAENSLSEKLKNKAMKVSELLDIFTQTNDLNIYKIKKNSPNEIEVISCSLEWFVGIKEYDTYLKLSELCEIDIDTKTLEDVEMIIKFTIKED